MAVLGRGRGDHVAEAVAQIRPQLKLEVEGEVELAAEVRRDLGTEHECVAQNTTLVVARALAKQLPAAVLDEIQHV